MIDVLKKVRERLIEEQKSISMEMATGVCDTIEDYKRLVGVVQGVEFSLAIIDEERKKHLEEDEYDDGN